MPIIGPQAEQRAPLHCYRIDLRSTTRRTPRHQDREQRDEPDAPLLCAACTAVITWPARAVSRMGRHEHVFFNPAGLAFEVCCFSRAPGCLLQGDATEEFTWFPGYLWRIALCRSCLVHLGWHFQSPDDDFFALIKNRLLE